MGLLELPSTKKKKQQRREDATAALAAYAQAAYGCAELFDKGERRPEEDIEVPLSTFSETEEEEEEEEDDIVIHHLKEIIRKLRGEKSSLEKKLTKSEGLNKSLKKENMKLKVENANLKALQALNPSDTHNDPIPDITSTSTEEEIVFGTSDSSSFHYGADGSSRRRRGSDHKSSTKPVVLEANPRDVQIPDFNAILQDYPTSHHSVGRKKRTWFSKPNNKSSSSTSVFNNHHHKTMLEGVSFCPPSKTSTCSNPTSLRRLFSHNKTTTVRGPSLFGHSKGERAQYC